MQKPLVIVTRRLPEAIEDRMRELFGARLRAEDRAMSRDDLAAALGEATVLVPTVTDRLDADLLAAAGPQLKLIANFGNGVDNIDVAAAQARGIAVTNTPGVLSDDTADFTIALILAVFRRFPEGARVIPDQGWSGWSPSWMLGRRIGGKKLGIVGMGRIGVAVARRARAFGFEIHYHNRRRTAARIEAELEAMFWPSLDQMLARMDVVTVHCPHTPATFHLLSARRLKLLRPDAIVINTARGGIIDEEALTDLLEKGLIGGAGLDVFENEPDVPERLRRLAREGKATLLPHMGSATVEGRMEMGEKVIINIKTFIDGHRPPNRVLRDE